jgi:WD40 repeat protein
MILAGQLASPADVRRFHAEAEAAANLDHPHIIPVYEVGEQDGLHFFAMKLVEGGDLAERRDQVAADPRAAARLMVQVARAVHHAHQHGILHRDLKPANILLDGQGVPYVSDFGLAKRVEGEPGQTRTGAVIGTPSFMSPEQAGANKSVTTATDIYSLGAILYDLAAGRPPFVGTTPTDVLLQVLEREPEPLRKIRPGVNVDLETIVAKCLEKDPERRYESAAELADDLERWLDDEPIRARPIGPWGRWARWCRRYPVITGLAAVAIISLVIGAVFSIYFGVQATDRAREAVQEKERADANAQEAQASVRAYQKVLSQLEREQEAKNRLLYAAHVNLAYRLWQEAQLGRAVELLQRHQPAAGAQDLRGWEWNYVDHLCHAGFRELPGAASDGLNSVAFSADGRLVGACGNVGEVTVWEAGSGTVRQRFWVGRPLYGLAFSPDGGRLAAAGRPGLVWDLATAKEVPGSSEWLHDSLDVAFQPRGALLAVARASTSVRRWDLVKGVELPALPHAGVRTVAFSPDGRLLASGGLAEPYVKVWDAASGKELWSYADPWAGVHGVAFSPDSRLLAAAGQYGTIRLWEAATGKERAVLKGHADWVNHLAFHPDGSTVASAGDDRTVRI